MSKPAKPAAPDAPKKSKKMLFIIIAAVLLLGGGGAAAFLMMNPHPGKKADAHAKEAHAAEAQAVAAPKIFDLVGEAKPLVVNLVHEEGDRYLQVEISLQLSDPEVEERIKTNIKLVMDAVNTVLAKKRPSDLSAEGWLGVKSELKAELNYTLGYSKTPPVVLTPPVAVASATGASTEQSHAPVNSAPGGHAAVTAQNDASEPEHGITRVIIPHYLVQ